MRTCGDCQACCRLLLIRELNKPAGQRCQHQKYGVGCAIYSRRPIVCAEWTCRWVTNTDTADMSRSDRSHYFIDCNPDVVTLAKKNGAEIKVPVVQIWVDPKFPNAHRDPALRSYLMRRAAEGIAGLIRWDDRRGMMIFPPMLSEDHQWHEVETIPPAPLS